MSIKSKSSYFLQYIVLFQARKRADLSSVLHFFRFLPIVLGFDWDQSSALQQVNILILAYYSIIVILLLSIFEWILGRGKFPKNLPQLLYWLVLMFFLSVELTPPLSYLHDDFFDEFLPFCAIEFVISRLQT